jgi:diguanylate cyclase (GGDEF)-like protein
VLCLSIRELDRRSLRPAVPDGHYVHVGRDVDPSWAEEAGRLLADVHERELDVAVTPSVSAAIRHEAGFVVKPESGSAEKPDTGSAGKPDSGFAGKPDSGSAGKSETGFAGRFLSCIAGTASGRAGALGLGSPAPNLISREDEETMLRLAAQVILVLDHALLVQQAEQTDMVDGLTGVANQRRLLDLLDYEMRRHRYGGTWLSLMLVDVEGLDSINRSYGHRYGNHILQKLAALIQGSVRPVDVIARCGLDEFAVILPDAGEEEAQRRAEAMRERFLGVEFAGGHIGISVAVAHVGPHETVSPERLIGRAEQALAETKRQERGWSAALS